MPLRKARPIIVAAAVSVAFGVGATSAGAATLAQIAANSVSTPAVAVSNTSEMNISCKEPNAFQAFSKIGDNAYYSFAPDGAFENGGAGWSFSGASIVAANESFGIFGGNRSLYIKKGGRVVSPWFCVTLDHPTFRYVTYGGEVEMEIDYVPIKGGNVDDKLVGETNGGSRWGASSIHPLATKIPLYKIRAGVLARVVFEAEDNVYVDNLLIDPYRRG